MKIYIIIILGIVAILTARAQKCGSSLNMPLIQKETPTLYNQLLQIENHTSKFINNQQLRSLTATDIVRIPVVVHVLYNTSIQNISDDQINSQIEVLNEDFRRLNADKSNTPSAFASLASDPQIEFFLACVDPDGNFTTGITRTQTTQVNFTWVANSNGTTDEVSTRIKFSSLGGRDAWPSNRYLNIWTCNFTGSILGYAQFPGVGQANTDGVVIKYDCFGKRGTLTSPYNKGRTATHEIGHWLNLIHIWGNDSDQNGSCIASECTGTDNVSDTPNQGEPNYGCQSFPKTDCCTASSPGVMFMNFMDYSNDACMNIFTTGQTNRMRALFSNGGLRECFVSNPAINDWCKSILTFSGPSSVCSSGSTYTVNGVPPGCTVNWTCSSNITFDNQPGNPKIFTANGSGSGWVRPIIVSTCDNVPLPRKTVWVGVPDSNLLSIEILDGYLTSCDYTSATAIYSGNAGIDAFEWYMPNAMNWTVREESGSGPDNKYVEIEYWEDPAPSYEDIYIRAHNSCGWSNWKSTAWPTVSCRRYLMVISPNPVTDEATIELVNKKDNTPIEFTEWDYEIYDSMQGMKEKKTKLKSAESKISTSGWKDGIYIIRAMVDKELVTGKLVVKH